MVTEFYLHFDSFIENFGTHVITSITIGGKDVIYVKQHNTSPLSKLEIKNYIQDIGNQRFSDINSHTSSGQTKSKDKASSLKFHIYLYTFMSFKFNIGWNITLGYINFIIYRVLNHFHSIVKEFTLNLQQQHILPGKKYVIYVVPFYL
jgi:hypothetical protein